MIKIRPYQESDFEEICSWWKRHGETPPLPGMMVEEGTFVLEKDDKPVMTLTVLMTQTREISYFEGYCKSPELPKRMSNELGKILWQHGFQYLKERGFKRVIILTDKDALSDRYERLGMSKNMSGIHALGRVL